jgi:hypothetical protein
MAWTYEQASGRFSNPDGFLVAVGYSGHPPEGKNNPALQDVHNVGPIPQGKWQAVELITDSATHGPYAIRLEAYPETQTFGRSGFMIHGDSIAEPGFASDGCLILSRDVRELFWKNADHDVTVVSGIEEIT